ncbi:hypothetical protein [Larkinella sp.]|uniref:hypothetical protein n=1 Tax=Larkinella sp. TaxID=2034517 RepID=UPI003BA9945E
MASIRRPRPIRTTITSNRFLSGRLITNSFSGVMVPVFAYGPHSLDFRGVYENTAIHHKIMAVLGRYRNTQKTK